jgi:predicted SnoaL-like aldol condensation-catalyzing enzyme
LEVRQIEKYISSTAQGGEFSMGTEDNKDLSQRFLEELWNQKNLSILDKLLADAYVDHTPPLEPLGPQGPEALKRLFEALRQVSSDIRVSIEDQIAEEDKVTNRLTWECTFESGDPPTASQVIVMGVGIDRIDDDKIAESWNTLDVPYRLLNVLKPIAQMPQPRHCDRRNPCPPGYICRNGICLRV